MTTPAVNNDAGLSTDGSVWEESRNTATGAVVVPYHKVLDGKTMTQWRAYIRPKSASSGRRDQSGWRPPLPYNFTREVSAIHASPVIETFRSGPNTVSRYYFDGYGCYWREQRPTFYELALVDRAVGAALLKLKNQKVNFGVAFGEYKETAELVSSTLRTISTQIRAFRSKNPRLWGQVLKHQLGAALNPKSGAGRGHGIPHAWLEVQYGWNPLMDDVSGACQQLSAGASGGHPFRVTCHGRARSMIDSWSWGKVTDHTASGLRLHKTGRNFAHVRLDYELNGPLLATLSSLGLTNPQEIVWELLPYSFVLDWFLPIGNWLRTMDADFGWRFLGGTLTQGYDYVTEGQGIQYPPGMDPSITGMYSTGFATSRQSVLSFSRSVYTSSPRAGYPTLKNPLSVQHVANGLSLLLNAFH